MADRTADIVAAARELLDTEGVPAVTMRRIAEKLGIRAPSLYKHLPDKGHVETALQTQCLTELAVALETVEADHPGDLLALALAYRRFAVGNPHLYRITRVIHRDALPEGVEYRAAMPLLRAVGGNMDVARAVWAFAHGMVVLELDDRFPPGADLDTAWRIGCEAFARTVTPGG
ncbi:TetR/AcrR family transcriptional regulator [Phytomonospora endophytica]|uniref:AcrR family transcriptional regulator n=1 Tax=Phytomonospora endophytica TaxID=714109 RepID=A0A841FYI4_9ACTN|nr:TetR/AcrR family transcriptional regulator [Phytomonospora endophytica]MBB6037499.1 AcrR family transcriptional regulator [Phytomonospora endophytica]GIG70750.1 TetR family transcriptional regulator [Phytomonospora endophytica]